jgi:hypothetical protein
MCSETAATKDLDYHAHTTSEVYMMKKNKEEGD